MIERQIEVASDITVSNKDAILDIAGNKGSVAVHINDVVTFSYDKSSNLIKLSAVNEKKAKAMLGTACALIKNALVGVSNGYEKKLELSGVGYRAQLQGNKLNLTLGYSHPIEYAIPAGISIEVPKQTEITVKGFDKQLVGQVAAEIREFRKVEPYKGKGIRYLDEVVIRKDAKKK